MKNKFSSSVTVTENDISIETQNLPNWLDSSQKSMKNGIERAVQNAQRSRFNTGLTSFPIRSDNKQIPKKINQSLSSYMNNQFETDKESVIPSRQGYRHTLRLTIEYNSQGTVKDIYIESHFKN